MLTLIFVDVNSLVPLEQLLPLVPLLLVLMVTLLLLKLRNISWSTIEHQHQLINARP